MRLDVEALRHDLSRDIDLFACAETCCHHLRAAGYELPSIYLERAGVLRCYGSLGYWQVLDGFPLTAGVIGATARSGRTMVVDVSTSDLYLAAAPGVVGEVCAPVMLDGRFVGAINLESRRPMPPEAVTDAETTAACFGARFDRLGGLPRPDGWRLVADAAPQIQRMRDPQRIVAKILDVALALSPSRSGLVALDTGDGPRAAHVSGPLGGALAGLSPKSLSQIASWVQGPRSCYTVGEPDGQGFTGHDSLRATGVESLSVFALDAGDDRLGFLLLGDESPVAPELAVVEQTELLASIAACALGTSFFVEQLVDLSRRDPLTGLGHSRAFRERLRAIERTHHLTHAIVSIDVDHFKHINDTHGHATGDRVLRILADAMEAELRTKDCVFRTGGDEFAAVVAVDDETEALAVARRLRHAAQGVGVSVSVGVALATPGGDQESVFTRADQAMYHVKRNGRGDVFLASAPPLRQAL